MFGVQLYPTPPEVTYRMIEPFIGEYKDAYYQPTASRILEPSAGRGDIADFLTKEVEYARDGQEYPFPKWRYGRKWSKDHILCIEIDPDLQRILQGKDYPVIDSDFLAYDGADPVDMIVMNPPFNDGLDHLTHAWQIASRWDGQCDIVCLLNSETLKNPYTQKRMDLLELIRRHGRYEHIGQAFADSDNPTDVEVSIVWLCKQKRESVIDLDSQRFAWDTDSKDSPFSSNSPAVRDTIESIVAQYNAARTVLEQMAEKRSRFKFYVDPFKGEYVGYDMDKAMGEPLEAQVARLKVVAWRYVFHRTKFGDYVTSRYQKKFTEQQTKQSRMAFSVVNIYNLIDYFRQNQRSILYECLLDVFDRATANHKNRIMGEGWKTNKSYKLNYKIIFPGHISRTMWGDGKDFVDDLDKVCCYVTGRDYEHLRTTYKAIQNHFAALDNTSRGKGDPVGYSDAFYSDFFKIRIYKKGTAHLAFRDGAVCDSLNRQAAIGKGWQIGGGY